MGADSSAGTLRPVVQNVVTTSHGTRPTGMPHGRFFESGDDLCLPGQVRRTGKRAVARGRQPSRGTTAPSGGRGSPSLVWAGTALVPQPVAAGGRLVQRRCLSPVRGA